MPAETVHPAPGTSLGFSPGPQGFSAFVVERTGDSTAAGIRTLSVDDLPAGDVLIRVDWSALNYKDGMVAQPGNLVARISPLIPGVDLVGTVVIGSGYAAGQPVIVHGYDLGVAHHGGFAEYALGSGRLGGAAPRRAQSPARGRHRNRAGFTAALLLRRLEIHGLTQDRGPVLVTGASGGVGSMSVALLASPGLRSRGQHR